MSKIVIIGASGFIGSQIADFFQSQNWEVITDRVDFTDFPSVKKHLETHQPDVVLNCAGPKIEGNVDWCESHRAETILGNVQGPLNLACACDHLKIFFANIGSGCVFQGSENFSETDDPNFDGSFYSFTKALGEKLMLRAFNFLQLRIRIPISSFPHPKNLITKLLNYPKIISVENSFTVIEDFIPAAFALINQRQTGIFHMTNPGSTDAKFIMTKYQEIVDPEFTPIFMDMDEFQGIICAARSNTTLDSSKRENLGIHMPDIKERIPEILLAFKQNLS